MHCKKVTLSVVADQTIDYHVLPRITTGAIADQIGCDLLTLVHRARSELSFACLQRIPRIRLGTIRLAWS